MIASYTANLASFLVVTSQPTGIASLADLAASASSTLCVNTHATRGYYELQYPRLRHRIHIHHESSLAAKVANGTCTHHPS
jgi:hypothetical protein